MANRLSRILIEKVAAKMLRSFRDDSKGGIRGFLETMLNFGNEHFQTGFFKRVQKVLCDENGVYYQLLRRTASDVDHDRLLRLGMNIAYNGVLSGSRRIRQIEAAEGFDVPWALHLQLEQPFFEQHFDSYVDLVRQGREMGVYTWFIYADKFTDALCKLISDEGECAFAVMVNADCLSEADIDRAAKLKNLMLSVGIGKDAEAVCRRMHERKMLYTVHVRYTPDAVEQVMNDEVLHTAQQMNAPAVFFVPDKACTPQQNNMVYEYVECKRDAQQFRTLACAIVQDVLTIDRVISPGRCAAGFYADGTFASTNEEADSGVWNLLDKELRQIFSEALKKQ